MMLQEDDVCQRSGYSTPEDPFVYKFFCEFDYGQPVPSRIKPFSGWLARDGRFFLCGYAQHGILARKLYEQEWPGGEYITQTNAEHWLVERGWHRIDPYGTITTGYGQFHRGFSPEQESTLRKLAELSEPGGEFEAAMVGYLEYIETEGTR
jgi:hypothetical protein